MRLRAALAFALLTTPALALDLPARKSGLWELKMNLAGHSAAMPAFQHCIDAATDKEMMLQGNARGQKCSKQDVQRAGDTITIDSVCDIGNGTTATSHAVVSGDFNSAYTVKVEFEARGRAGRAWHAGRDEHDDRGEMARRVQGRPEAR